MSNIYISSPPIFFFFQDALSSRKAFVRYISHEVRTPLNIGKILFTANFILIFYLMIIFFDFMRFSSWLKINQLMNAIIYLDFDSFVRSLIFFFYFSFLMFTFIYLFIHLSRHLFLYIKLDVYLSVYLFIFIQSLIYLYIHYAMRLNYHSVLSQLRLF